MSTDLARRIRSILAVALAFSSAVPAGSVTAAGMSDSAPERQQAIDAAIRRVHKAERAEPPLDRVPKPPRSSGMRVPDPGVNGVRWFYVFGKEGETKYGALKEPQRVTIQVPRTVEGSVTIYVLDADIREKYDEMDGDSWNTSTRFSVTGAAALDARTVTPKDSDGLTLQFGPYSLQQGEAHGEDVLFHVEAEGLGGNDNNLFALQVQPALAQAFNVSPAIRLSEEQGREMQFFPAIPAEATRLIVEQNYDLDPDGGRVVMIPRVHDGRAGKAIPVSPSGSGTWSTTEMSVPPDTDGTRWTYRIIKATQRKGNMSFRVSDQAGGHLPIYMTRGKAGGMSIPTRSGEARPGEALVTPTGACNEFEFDGSESYDPDRSPLTYAWDFGDGAAAEGMRVRHTYADAGTYQVRLKIDDQTSTACCLAEATQTLTVNTPPKAVLEAPEKVCLGAPVHLSGARSSDSAGESLRYLWDFGDGMTGDGIGVDHVYAKGGVYQVKLTVDDGMNTACSRDQVVSTIKVNSPPVVRVSEDIRQCAAMRTGPMDVTLSADGSRDPEGDSLTYHWDFGDGSTGSGKRVTHSYQKGGRYTAGVVVDDGSGSTCSIAVGVVGVQLNHPPVVVAGSSVAGCSGEVVTLKASDASDADGDTLTYRWDFGDGQTGDGSMTTHQYATSGTYQVKLTADDGSGMSCNTATTSTSALINAPPVARMKIRGLHQPSPSAARSWTRTKRR